MSCFEGEVLVDAKGRRAVRFTTSSGVRVIADLAIPPDAIQAFIKKLSDKLERRRSAAGRTSHRRGSL